MRTFLAAGVGKQDKCELWSWVLQGTKTPCLSTPQNPKLSSIKKPNTQSPPPKNPTQTQTNKPKKQTKTPHAKSWSKLTVTTKKEIWDVSLTTEIILIWKEKAALCILAVQFCLVQHPVSPDRWQLPNPFSWITKPPSSIQAKPRGTLTQKWLQTFCFLVEDFAAPSRLAQETFLPPALAHSSLVLHPWTDWSSQQMLLSELEASSFYTGLPRNLQSSILYPELLGKGKHRRGKNTMQLHCLLSSYISTMLFDWALYALSSAMKRVHRFFFCFSTKNEINLYRLQQWQRPIVH